MLDKKKKKNLSGKRVFEHGQTNNKERSEGKMTAGKFAVHLLVSETAKRLSNEQNMMEVRRATFFSIGFQYSRHYTAFTYTWQHLKSAWHERLFFVRWTPFVGRHSFFFLVCHFPASLFYPHIFGHRKRLEVLSERKFEIAPIGAARNIKTRAANHKIFNEIPFPSFPAFFHIFFFTFRKFKRSLKSGGRQKFYWKWENEEK